MYVLQDRTASFEDAAANSRLGSVKWPVSRKQACHALLRSSSKAIAEAGWFAVYALQDRTAYFEMLVSRMLIEGLLLRQTADLAAASG